MNTKISFPLFLIIITLLVTAFSSTDTRSSAPIDPIATPVPLTGDPSAEMQRLEMEPRLQSGEIFLSDIDNPDVQLNIQTDIQQDLRQTGCISGDEQPRPYSGCVE